MRGPARPKGTEDGGAGSMRDVRPPGMEATGAPGRRKIYPVDEREQAIRPDGSYRALRGENLTRTEPLEWGGAASHLPAPTSLAPLTGPMLARGLVLPTRTPSQEPGPPPPPPLPTTTPPPPPTPAPPRGSRRPHAHPSHGLGRAGDTRRPTENCCHGAPACQVG